MKPSVTALFILLFARVLIAGTIDRSIEDRRYVEYGEKFSCVYRICGQYDNGQVFCASAVAIDNNWLLTAAHVVKGAKTAVISHDNKDSEIKITEIICSNNFKPENFGYGDIAICYVDTDLGLDSYPTLYEGQDEQNKVCSISGYGITGNFDTGAKISDGKRRAGSNQITRIEKELLICDPTRRSHKGHTELEFLIASGDSGGGLFIDGKLAGINSCVMSDGKNPNSSYDDESGHTRISQYVGWIKEKIQNKK